MPILKVSGISVSFRFRKGLFGGTGVLKAVDDVSLEIAPGEVLGLVGDSGCGKTTLSRAILGLTHTDLGTIVFNGYDITKVSRRSKLNCCGIQAVFQDPFSSLNPRMTILDTLTEAALVHGILKPENKRISAEKLLADVGMPLDILDRYPHAFSGGQRQRICIARALSLNPALLICDEPVSALDVSVQAQVLNLLMDLREQRGLAMLFISHNMAVVRHVSDRIAIMKSGRIVEVETVAG